MRVHQNLLTICQIAMVVTILFHGDIRADEWEKFKERYGNHFIVRWHPTLRTPRLVYGQGIPLGNTFPLSDDNVVGYANAFLAINKDFFQVAMTDLQLKSIKHVGDNWSVKFQQYYRNIPVEGGIIGISITDRGFINLIGSGYYPGIETSTSPAIDTGNAIAIAKRQYSDPEKTELKAVSLVILPIEFAETLEFNLAWKIEVLYHNDLLTSKTIFVNASSGNILKEKELMAGSGINGTVKGHVWLTPPRNSIIPPSTLVFYPNLIVKLYGTQYQAVTDENGSYNLSQGQLGTDQVFSTFENADIKLRVDPYSPVPGHSIEQYLSTQPSWTWVDTTNHGGEYNVFYWLNFMHGYFLDNFAYDILDQEQLDVRMYGSATSAWGNIMVFNYGPYQMRDKFIIFHEYTHSIQGDIDMAYFGGTESQAFCEGTAAYFPCSLTNDPHGYTITESDWLDSPATPYYYEDYIQNGDYYYNGTIIAKAIWTFRTQMGNAIATDGLIIEAFNILSNFPNSDDPNARVYSDFVAAVLMADDNDANPINGTPNESTILSSFGTHHIYPSGYIVSGNISGNTTLQTDTYITGNVTVISGVTLSIASGAKITINSGVTVTVEGNLSIASGATITGGGSIVTSGNGKIYSTYSAAATQHNNSRKIARDASGNVHVVFENQGEVCYEKWASGGSALSEFKRLSGGNGGHGFPCIAERDGNLYIIWQRYNGSTYSVNFRKYASGAWGATTALASNISTSNNPLPVIASPASSKLMVIFRGAATLRHRISDDDGATWAAAANVPAPTRMTIPPRWLST